MRLWYSANSRSVQLDVTTVGRLLCIWMRPVVDQLTGPLPRPRRVRLRAEVVQGQQGPLAAIRNALHQTDEACLFKVVIGCKRARNPALLHHDNADAIRQPLLLVWTFCVQIPTTPYR